MFTSTLNKKVPSWCRVGAVLGAHVSVGPSAIRRPQLDALCAIWPIFRYRCGGILQFSRDDEKSAGFRPGGGGGAVRVLDERWFSGDGKASLGLPRQGSLPSSSSSGGRAGGGGSGHVDVVRVSKGLAPDALRALLRGQATHGAPMQHGPATQPGAGDAAATATALGGGASAVEGTLPELPPTERTNGAVSLLRRQKEKRARVHHSAVLPDRP